MRVKTSVDRYIERFFEEKELENKTFEIKHRGNTHLIDSETIIDIIKEGVSHGEKKQIADTLIKIDFANGDINHFLEHLATGYVKTNY